MQFCPRQVDEKRRPIVNMTFAPNTVRVVRLQCKDENNCQFSKNAFYAVFSLYPIASCFQIQERVSTCFEIQHVMKTASACFAVLRQLKSIRRSVPDSCFPVTRCVTCPHAAGLQQGDTGRHSSKSHSSAAIGHERYRTVDPLGLMVPTYHTAPASASLTSVVSLAPRPRSGLTSSSPSWC